MHLYLDTTNNLKTIIKLDGQEFVTSYNSPREQDVLGALMSALDKSRKTIQDISEIEICTGPGSFTGIRVGLSIVGALSLALNIPVNGLPPGSYIEPNYGGDASITMSSKNS